MRLTSFLVGMALAAMPLVSRCALAGATEGTAQPPAGVVMRLAQAQNCPPGTHWVESSYARGKYRQAHCANDNGKD